MSADTNIQTSPSPASASKAVAPRLRIGTRGSPLALWQAHAVQAALAAALGRPAEGIAIEIIRTTGDTIQDRALSEAGGKGLFTKEIEDALLEGRIDLAVHSAKDVATVLPEGLHLSGYLPRADVRDALILKRGAGLDDLPAGAKVGTASLRRAAQMKRLRPDLKVELLRGNVHTRLARVREGDFDATLLAFAGLSRLGLAHEANAVLETRSFLPAVGQGAVAIECRVADAATNAAIAAIACRDTGIALAAERAFLAALDGSCRTPIAGLATVEGDLVRLAGLVLALDGSDAAETEDSAPIAEAAALGARCGGRLRDSAPARALGL
ncbi:hydroxymethylbilane synthase [Xanthobacter agilis]|uniref:Porphobilinogen deaminase n=1 Tax=Xanthobacter agilis TaxID=47492 RepID=A0ABU0LIL6_XANAG|nr:hydroxymethylbilane synthase [Xanthobacter agilis]MDQ0506981.1 hydroxymethylbilane synthase [Xanthobacter agilis]